jgi:hypothetical protein
MNLKNLTFVCSVALSALLVPAASAQSRGGGRSQMAAPSAPRVSVPIRSGSGSQFAGRGSGWNGPRDGNRWGNNNGSNHWRGGDRGNWRYRCYPRYYSYYGFGYPFGFGYGYPFGYGYGYPYYGASAALYYTGYNGYGYGYGDRYRYGDGYRPRYAYNNGGGSVVTRVQQRLARSGYYRGPIDGVIGSGTRSGIRAWERAHGLRVDGRIDSQLLSSMGIA